jgi:protein phosphatase
MSSEEPMEMRIASLTDTGRARVNNEDSLLADPPLLAVADGMGGHEGGEVASSIAIDVIKSWKDRLEGSSGREAADRLAEAFREANKAVFERGAEDETVRGMGTTLTAAWVSDGTVALAHVGDSRAYLLRGDKLQQLTEDQNVAQEMVRRGRLTAAEAASSPQRHIVLQAIGPEADGIDVDVASAELRPGDRLVLASDGLFGMLKSDDAMRDILIAHTDNDEACRALIDAANEAGGADNISVVILELPGDGGDPEPVVIDRGEPAPVTRAAAPAAAEPSSKERRIPRLALASLGAIAVLAVMVLVLFVSRDKPNYVVSTRGGVVVVLDGRAGDNRSPASGKVVASFADEKLKEFPTTTQRQLRAGYEVETLQEGRALVKDLPRQLGPKDTPTPAPSASATPKASARPSPTP